MLPTMGLGGSGRVLVVDCAVEVDEEPPNGMLDVDVPVPDPEPPDSPDPLKIASSASPTSAAPTTAAVVSLASRPGGARCNMTERFSFALRATRGSGLRVAFTKSDRARCQSCGTPSPSA